MNQIMQPLAPTHMKLPRLFSSSGDQISYSNECLGRPSYRCSIHSLATWATRYLVRMSTSTDRAIIITSALQGESRPRRSSSSSLSFLPFTELCSFHAASARDHYLLTAGRSPWQKATKVSAACRTYHPIGCHPTKR